MTLFVSHAACLAHDTTDNHPEHSDRLRAVLAALDAPEFDALARVDAPQASKDQIMQVHPASHIQSIEMAALHAGTGSPVFLDADTVVSTGSYEAALRAAGAVCAAVDAVLADEAGNSFCGVRPPGHHAEPAKAMGFCLFNSIAIGARHALRHPDINKVAIVDFDVHHGNGTQAVFQADPTCFYASSHQSPLYPGTGAASETGAGNILNVPLAAGAGTVDIKAAYNGQIIPALEQFAPDMLFVSAGFDAHALDPLAGLSLTTEDYGWLSDLLCRFAGQQCQGRLVSVLEGGYNLSALAESVSVHVKTLMKYA
jgi:acetoin utilization deacetylase AcuC-like enzyme